MQVGWLVGRFLYALYRLDGWLVGLYMHYAGWLDGWLVGFYMHFPSPGRLYPILGPTPPPSSLNLYSIDFIIAHNFSPPFTTYTQ